jgi:hypothetical protein
MDGGFPDFLKAARAFQAAAKAVAEAEKAAARTPRDPSAVEATATKAVALLAAIRGAEAVAGGVSERLGAQAAEARASLERERALLAGAVARTLGEAGIPVEGNLPLLRAGAFSLEFTFGPKGACTIWFGPKKQKLGSAVLEAGAIATRVRECDNRLFGGPFDDAAFVRELVRAWRAALARDGLPDGARVPLPRLLVEFAVGRQGPAFLADPRRENFASYGRVDFAVALSRLKERAADGWELRLDVATLVQTKRPEDHLWVPRGRTGDGVNFATAHFARAG